MHAYKWLHSYSHLQKDNCVNHWAFWGAFFSKISYNNNGNDGNKQCNSKYICVYCVINENL